MHGEHYGRQLIGHGQSSLPTPQRRGPTLRRRTHRRHGRRSSPRSARRGAQGQSRSLLLDDPATDALRRGELRNGFNILEDRLAVRSGSDLLARDEVRVARHQREDGLEHRPGEVVRLVNIFRRVFVGRVTLAGVDADAVLPLIVAVVPRPLSLRDCAEADVEFVVGEFRGADVRDLLLLVFDASVVGLGASVGDVLDGHHAVVKGVLDAFDRVYLLKLAVHLADDFVAINVDDFEFFSPFGREFRANREFGCVVHCCSPLCGTMYPDTIKLVVQCTTIGDDHNWSESPRSVPNEEHTNPQVASVGR